MISVDEQPIYYVSRTDGGRLYPAARTGITKK